MPRASAITTCPKQPSPRGLPRVNLRLERRQKGGRGSGFSHKTNKQGAAKQLKQRVQQLLLGNVAFSSEAQPKVARTGARRGMRSGTQPGFTKAALFFFLSPSSLSVLSDSGNMNTVFAPQPTTGQRWAGANNLKTPDRGLCLHCLGMFQYTH